VQKKHYDNFTTLFSPFRPGPEYIDAIVSLCRQEYFYGLQGRAPAEAIINRVRDVKSIQFPYLLRISTTQGVTFCLSYIPNKKGAKLEIVHLPVAPSAYHEKGIEAYVKTFEHTYKVKSVDNYERTFQTIVFRDDRTQLTVQQNAGTQAYSGQASAALSGSIKIDG